MSLLLDALKKAAEQKAQQGQSEAPDQGSSDETLIRAGADDVFSFEESETGSARNDETELDHSEIRNRLESDLSQRIAGDETGLDIADTTDTRSATSPQEPVAGDETGLDIADVTGSRPESTPPEPGAGDDTGLDIPDVTEFRPTAAPPGQVAGDETGLDIAQVSAAAPRPAAPESASSEDTGIDIPDVTEARLESGRGARAEADETGLDIADGTETRVSEPSEQMQTGEDETIYFEGEDATDFADEHDAVTVLAPDADETDFSHPAAMADDIEPALPQRALEPGETAAGEAQADGEVVARAEDDEDQDLSLLLVDQTDLKANTSFTDPRISPDVAQLTSGSEDILDGLGLVDTDDHDVSGEQTNTDSTAVTSPTQAIVGADDTRQTPGAITQSTLTRTEATSTRTYAPDNYDRTLMRPPGDDVSRVFSGMKSDSDVVMTPDYAKKVFRSKTSAQSVQNYKIYGGITVVIMLAISIYGAFEYQDESYEIDTSLRPLKRDPMPGVIRTEKAEEIDLFATADAGTNARTIEIIETADEDASAEQAAADTEQVAEAETGDAEVEAGGTEVEAQEASPPLTQTEAEPVEPRQIEAIEVEPVELASNSRSAARGAEAIESAENLHIEMSTQVSETNTWLQQAYSAYQSGNYERAMELYNQVLEVDPDNRNALLARAAINIHDGYAEAAIHDYRRLLLANPKDSLAMSSLLTVASYNPEDTETQLKLMIRDEPDSPYLNFALANAYGAQNRWQEAQGYYFKALQNNPRDPNYAYNLAVSLEHISQPVSAITYYQRALENFEKGLATFSRDVVDERLQLLGKL
jgi:tetratricopeptide (TPR) repeat protein